MKHVPRRRLLAHFFVLPIYVILLYFCSFAITIHQLIQSSYIISTKLKAYVCPFNLDKTYPLYLMRISCSKVLQPSSGGKKNFDGGDDGQFTFLGYIRHICIRVDLLLCRLCLFVDVYDSR